MPSQQRSTLSAADECFRERVVSPCLYELRSLELSLQKEARACGSECNQ
jgi:hypothetical protein